MNLIAEEQELSLNSQATQPPRDGAGDSLPSPAGADDYALRLLGRKYVLVHSLAHGDKISFEGDLDTIYLHPTTFNDILAGMEEQSRQATRQATALADSMSTLDEMVSQLLRFVGEAGVSEGAADVLRRKLSELQRLEAHVGLLRIVLSYSLSFTWKGDYIGQYSHIKGGVATLRSQIVKVLNQEEAGKQEAALIEIIRNPEYFAEILFARAVNLCECFELGKLEAALREGREAALALLALAFREIVRSPEEVPSIRPQEATEEAAPAGARESEGEAREPRRLEAALQRVRGLSDDDVGEDAPVAEAAA